ncbi:hypothetical protein N7494_007619 [Penicillium frequentans]|uniref:Zn(2)-C6 fungal-type domain-containing protein n=1 Tax=Penicillium frequentans TaxID=3151616 RepID=A0AAD6CTG0_9EURO|nr:hypothetical protein N7494_007619 [Penicillium glabrum]
MSHPRQSDVAAAGSGAASAQEAEKRASSPVSKDQNKAAFARTPNPRSCVICRSRKVRCDKLSPCSNCRRGNIACIYPSGDRPPRWARRLERPVTGEVMERLHHLEGLVKELTGQLEQAHAAAKSSAASSNSPGSSTHDNEVGLQGNTSFAGQGSVSNKFGRLALNDANRSRYVGSGFWSWVNDEIGELKTETGNLTMEGYESSDDEISSKTPSTQELGRTPSDRHAFIFRHNLNPSTPDIREFHPLPSQIPFLLNVFSENVNNIAQIVHMPSTSKMISELRGDMSKLTPSNEALMFSIYYAAVTSMEEEDIMINFGVSKQHLNLKYRLGLEHALAKADFLNAPDLVLVQSLANFLLLARRHDSPRYVWMMTGIVIRMALALGLQRDGSNFGYLSPFEIEMRRRVWWSLCMIDVRASEDQGTDYTIALGSFDTKMPLNINSVDISPESKEMPPEHEGLTEMSLTRVNFGIVDVSKQMVTQISKSTSLEEQSRFLDEIFQRLQVGFLQYHSNSESNIMYWTSVATTRLVIGKMTLLVFVPVLFGSPTETLSEEIRNKLLVAAIEVAEYNHALNSEPACRQWRWVFQTYTHWHAIVYILLEISRRAWSPIVERAWVALHSIWLIPTQSHMGKNLRIWVPLRRLRIKAQQHRESELIRLRNDPAAVEKLERQDKDIQQPSSPGSFPEKYDATDIFVKKWRQLLSHLDVASYNTSGAVHTLASSAHLQNIVNPSPEPTLQPAYREIQGCQSDGNASWLRSTSTNRDIGSAHNFRPTQDITRDVHEQQSNQELNPSIIPWLWADGDFSNPVMDSVDINMDLDGSDVDWYSWVESAQGLELNFGPNGAGTSGQSL